MLARRRAAAVATAIPVIALLSGGVALAAAGGLGPTPHTAAQISDVTDSTGESTTSVEPTSSTAADTTSTAVDQTTTSVDETTTSVADTSTTSVEESTTTTSTAPAGAPASQACKPGWGYGDTNHCHSGPPGLVGHQQHSHGHGRGHH